MPQTLSDWYCLTPGRDNFKPHVVRDKKLVFCHDEVLTDEIITSIERRFASNEPIKMVIYGDWGIGKTHTIYHIGGWLEERVEDFPAKTVLVELGDVTKSSRANILVRMFIDALGSEFIIRLVHEYLKKTGDVPRSLEAAGVPGPVADAFSKLLLAAPGSTPPAAVLAAIDLLRGGRPNAHALALGFGQALEGSRELYGVLLALGEMYRTTTGSRLIFVADEAAKLESVEADEATKSHWVNFNKLAFDDQNNVFGIVYTVSGRRTQMPDVLFEAQLQNRLGQTNYFELRNLKPQDVGEFLKRLRDTFVRRECVDLLAAQEDPAMKQYDWNSYPFTSEARAEFIDYFSRSQENAKPRDISDKLNHVAFIAMKRGQRLIDVDSLRTAQI